MKRNSEESHLGVYKKCIISWGGGGGGAAPRPHLVSYIANRANGTFSVVDNNEGCEL